jgi:phage-related protein
MRRLSVAFNEGKETIGSMILNAITPLVDKLVKNVIPAIADFTSNLGDKLSPVIKFIMPIINGLRDYFDLVRDAVERNSEKLQPFFDVLKAIGTFIVKTLAPIIGETLGLALKGLGLLVGGLIDQFANFVDTLKTIYDRIMSVVNAIKGAIGAVGNFFSGASYSTPSYGSVTPSVPSTPSYVYAGYSSGGTTININGAIDPVGTANQINNILATGASTSGSYSNLGYAYV